MVFSFWTYERNRVWGDDVTLWRDCVEKSPKKVRVHFNLGNALMLTSVNSSLARSRGARTFLIETSFTVLLALVVIVSIRLVGILIANSLLVLPAAASRNLSRNVYAYTGWAVTISVLSGVAGLVASYYWGTASGATIVLFAAACYGLSALFGRRFRNRRFR